MNNKKETSIIPPKPAFFYGYTVVIAAFVIMAVSWGVYFSFGVFFKPVLTEFGWNRAITSGAFSLSMIVQGVVAIVTGALADRIGPRIVLTLTGIILGAGYICTSLVSEAWHFYLLQGLLVGIGISGTIVPLSITIARWFTARRSLMTGIVLAGTGMGQLIVAPVVSWLIDTYDWRLTYIIVGAAVLLLAVIGAQFVRRDPAKMGLVPYGEGVGAKQSSKPVALEFSLKEAVSTRQFWIVFALFFCLGFYRLTLITHLVPHTTDLGISAAIAASILATTGGANVVGRIAMGMVADRIGDRRNFIIGFILMSAAVLWLVPAREIWALYLFAMAFGFAHAGAGTSEVPLVASLFGLKSIGLIFGVVAVGITLGGTIGPVLGGYIFDVTGSYQVTFLLCAALGIFAVILTTLIKPSRDKRNGPQPPASS